MQGMMNAPIRAHEIATKIFDGVALVLQDDLNQGIWANTIEEAKLIAMDMMELMLITSVNSNLKLHVKKLHLGQATYVRFDRRIVKYGRHKPLKRHTTKALCIKYEDLKCKTDFMSFAGMCTAMEQYVPDLAQKIRGLKEEILSTALLPPKELNGVKLSIKQQNKLIKLNKTEIGRELFNEINQAIATCHLLHTPDTKITSKHKFMGVVDVSMYKTGGILMQQKLNKPPFIISRDPPVFEDQFINGYNIVKLFSKKLSPLQSRYGASTRELLGIKQFCKKFHKFLILKPFDVVGDCKAILSIFLLNRDSPQAKFVRWRSQLCHYKFQWWHRDGNKLQLADYASRLMDITDEANDEKQPPPPEVINNIIKHKNAIKSSIKNETGINNKLQVRFENMVDKRVYDEFKFVDGQTLINDMDDYHQIHVIQDDIIQFDNEIEDASISPLLLAKFLSSDVSRTTDRIDKYDSAFEMNEINQLKSAFMVDEPVPIELTNDYLKINQYDNINITDINVVNIKNKIMEYNQIPYDIQQINRIYDLIESKNAEDVMNLNQLIQIEELKLLNDNIIDEVKQTGMVYLNKNDIYVNVLYDNTLLNDLIGKNKELTNDNNYQSINPIMTRARTRHLKKKQDNYDNIEIVDLRELNFDDEKLKQVIEYENKIINSDIYLKPMVLENKHYYHRPIKQNIFINSKLSIINMVKLEQKRAYGNIINKLNNDAYKLDPTNVFDEHYIKLINENKLALRRDGIIVYNNKRILLAPLQRMSFIQMCHVHINHRGIGPTYDYVNKVVYVPNLYEDVKYYVERCPCQLFNKKRKNKYNLDKGPMSPYIVKKQNQLGFTDLFGPMHDGRFISILIDCFDDYIDLNVVKPTSLDIITKVFLKYNYNEGIMEKIYHDRGSYYTAKLTSIYKYIIGTSSNKMLAFNPWINFAESQMKSVNKALSINKYAYDNYLVNDLYMKLNSLKNDKKYMHYDNYIDSMKFSCNIKISPKTNNSPFELRRAYPYYSSIIELGLKLQRGRTLNEDDYCVNGVVDYNKFKQLLKNNYKLNFEEALKNRIKYERNLQLKYNDIPDSSLKTNDYVIYQPVDSVTNKNTPNEYYGFIIHKVTIPGKMYVIRSIFDRNLIIKDVSHGHLRKFYKPVWLDAMKALDGNLLRIDKLERKDEEVEFKEFIEDEIKVDRLDIRNIKNESINIIDDKFKYITSTQFVAIMRVLFE